MGVFLPRCLQTLKQKLQIYELTDVKWLTCYLRGIFYKKYRTKEEISQLKKE